MITPHHIRECLYGLLTEKQEAVIAEYHALAEPFHPDCAVAEIEAFEYWLSEREESAGEEQLALDLGQLF